MVRYLKLIACLLVFTSSFAQEKWSLRKCVDYALENNISIKQTDIQARFSALALKESKAAQIPNAGIGISGSYNFGLSNNPTTGILENNNFFGAQGGLQASVTLFNWSFMRNTIEANKLTLQADNEQTNKAKNDIALNVANTYLQILLTREQVNIARSQVDLDKSQLDNTRQQVNAGRLPEINAAELEAQLARDSSALITAETSVTQSLLYMKALLNLDAGAAFDVETPPVELIPIEPIADLQPEAVYAMALTNFPQQKVNELRIKAAQKSVAAARGRMYPSLSATGSIGSNYAHFKRIAIYQQTITGYQSTGLRANTGTGTYYDVEQPILQNSTTVDHYIYSDGFGKQLRENFGQSIGLSLNIPILNGRSARTAWERAKLNVVNYELTKQQGDLQLKQDIYNAYVNAVAAIEKFNANKKTVATAERAFDFAQKRYELGLMSTFELTTSQNNLQRAKYDLVYAQYDYVFKMKLLEFYRGQGLKL